jgi:predicted nuclease of predicted toxin-antitoxin system
MLRLKVDENLPFELVLLLRAAGMDVCHALDQQLGGKPDREVARICATETRALVTLDLDFADVRKFPPGRYPGILVLRLRRQDTESVLSVFRRLLPTLTVERVAGTLWIIDEVGVRVRSVQEE